MSFSVFSLNPLLEQTIRNSGCTAPPSSHQQAIPSIIEQHDLLERAQTRTGKAAAFALPTIRRLRETFGKQFRALFLFQPGNWLNRFNELINTIIRQTRLCCGAVRIAMRRNGRKQHPAFGRGLRVPGTLSLGVNLLTPQAFLDLPGDLTA